jgi:hypothetical protein
MPIMTNGLNWLPPHLVGYGGAMNNIMQRMSSALGVAAMGVLINRETAQASADVGARLTPASLPPQFQNLDQAGLLDLYQYVQNHVQAVADGDMFLVAATATGVCAVLALFLRRPRARTATAPASTAARVTRSPQRAPSPTGRQPVRNPAGRPPTRGPAGRTRRSPASHLG